MSKWSNLARRPKVLCPRCGREIAQNQRRRHEEACAKKYAAEEAKKRESPTHIERNQMPVQKIDYPNDGGINPTGDNPRIETGAVQFGEDWPGLFIRGDNAMLVAAAIDAVLSNLRPETVKEIGQYAVVLSELAEMIREEVYE